MLPLCVDDALGLLVDALVVPAGVEAGEVVGDAVVLAEEDGVQDGQVRLFVDAGVAFGEGSERR